MDYVLGRFLWELELPQDQNGTLGFKIQTVKLKLSILAEDFHKLSRKG